MKKKLTVSIIAALALIAGVLVFQYQGKNDVKPYGYGFKKNITNSNGEIVNFSLLDHTGVFHELYRKNDMDFLVFISHRTGNWPGSMSEKINTVRELKKNFSTKKINFFFVNSNPLDDRKALIKWSEENHLDVPILMDPSQLISEILGLKFISQVVVIRTDGWKNVYTGPLSSKSKEALQTLLYKQGVLSENSENSSPIQFQFPTKISFEKEIRPIIKQKCLYCHGSERGFLPYLDSYEKIKNWSAMSRETILTERMPPYSADPFYGTYSNDKSLSSKEKATIVKWIDQGSPYDGNSGEKTFPAPVPIESKYRNLTPNYTATMNKAIQVPPGGRVEYSYSQLGGPAPFDLWVEAIRFRSSNPRQLHHASLMVTSKPLDFYQNLSVQKNPEAVDPKLREEKKDGDIELFVLGTLVNYENDNNPYYVRSQVFGAGKKQTVVFQQGTKLLIKKGSYLILESHHMGTGREETEKSTLDFYGTLERGQSTRQLHNKTLTNWKLKIPPRVRDFKVDTANWVIERKIGLLSILGHLHMRGRALKLIATTPDGKSQTVASIPNYYYGWQTGSGLVLDRPRFFEPGTTFKAECTFDNSEFNPFNPDPEKTIVFGQRVDRTEMCLMHMAYYYPEEI